MFSILTWVAEYLLKVFILYKYFNSYDSFQRVSLVVNEIVFERFSIQIPNFHKALDF